MTIGQRIKAEREAQGLGRPELVALSGVKYPTLAGIENGDQASSTKLHAIAAALKVNPKWLETGRGPKEAHGDLRHATSQVARPDPAILAQTQEFLETAFAFQGKAFDLRTDADLFADAYEWLAEDERPVDQRNLVHFGRWLAERQQAREAVDEDEDRRTTGKTAGTHRGRAASAA